MQVHATADCRAVVRDNVCSPTTLSSWSDDNSSLAWPGLSLIMLSKVRPSAGLLSLDTAIVLLRQSGGAACEEVRTQRDPRSAIGVAEDHVRLALVANMLPVSAPATSPLMSVRFGECGPITRSTRYVAPGSAFQTTFFAGKPRAKDEQPLPEPCGAGLAATVVALPAASTIPNAEVATNAIVRPIVPNRILIGHPQLLRPPGAGPQRFKSMGTRIPSADKRSAVVDSAQTASNQLRHWMDVSDPTSAIADDRQTGRSSEPWAPNVPRRNRRCSERLAEVRWTHFITWDVRRRHAKDGNAMLQRIGWRDCWSVSQSVSQWAARSRGRRSPTTQRARSPCVIQPGARTRVCSASSTVKAGQACGAGQSMLQWPSRGFQWRGPWSTGTTYNTNSAVGRDGSTYIATKPNRNVAPPNGFFWALMASAGAQGPPGGSGTTVHTVAASSTVSAEPSPPADIAWQDLSGPTITVTAPASGLIEFFARVDVSYSNSSSPCTGYAYAGVSIDGQVPSGGISAAQTCDGSFQAAGDLKSLMLTPGNHTFKTLYAAWAPLNVTSTATYRNRQISIWNTPLG